MQANENAKEKEEVNLEKKENKTESTVKGKMMIDILEEEEKKSPEVIAQPETIQTQPSADDKEWKHAEESAPPLNQNEGHVYEKFKKQKKKKQPKPAPEAKTTVVQSKKLQKL